IFAVMSGMACASLPPTCLVERTNSWSKQLPRECYRRLVVTVKAKADSSLLGAVHETAGDLHRLGFIDKRRMQQYDALCLEPVREYDAARIKLLRERLQLSQSVLASVLNVSDSTVRKWEAGDKKPAGASRKLLDLLDRKGLGAVL